MTLLDLFSLSCRRRWELPGVKLGVAMIGLAIGLTSCGHRAPVAPDSTASGVSSVTTAAEALGEPGGGVATAQANGAPSGSSRTGQSSQPLVLADKAGVDKGQLNKVPEKDRPLSSSELANRDRLAAKVLDPGRFRTKQWQDRPTVPASYAIAKKHPDILERLFCYCGCDYTDAHVTLLDCFTDKDEHGATCSECIEEAFLADRLYRDGATMARIQQMVDENFCTKYPFSPSERTKTYRTYLATKRLYTNSSEPICGDSYSSGD